MTVKAPEKLRNWIDARGMKHGFFAQQVGCHFGSLSRWLSGSRVPSPADQAKIEALTDGAIKAGEW